MANAVKKATLEDSGALCGGGIYELWKVFDAELVASTTAVESILGPTQYGFDLRQFKYFGLWAKAESDTGTAAMSISILQSYDDSTTANYVAPAVGGTVVSALAETAVVYSVSPSPMPRLRFRATGTGSNPADTTLTLWAWFQG